MKRGALALGAAAILYAIAVAYLAWPLSRHPASLFADFATSQQPLARWTAIDRDLAAWVLGWTAGASVTQPLAIFQANIFHPAPDSLASSENLLGMLPVAAPVFLATRNPVLTHNLMVFALVWTLAMAGFVAVRGWTRSAAAGLLGGALVAFAPIVVASWSNVISGTAVHWFPLVLLLAWRAAEEPRASLLVALAAVVALQILSGLYVAYQLMVVVAAFVPGLWLTARRHGRRPWPVLLALTIGFVVLLPLSVPYLRVRARGVLPDPATARLIVSSLAPTWTAAARTVLDNLGWPGLLLALLGLAAPIAPVLLRASLLLAAALTFVLSRGPNVALLPFTTLPGLYEIAMRFVPGFASMRASGRFLIVTVLLLALLAGIGAAFVPRVLRVRFGARGARLGAGALIAATLLLVVVRGATGLPTRQVPARSGGFDVYAWLRAHGEGGALLELPAMVSPMDARDVQKTGDYLLGATIHRLPMLNGYSGHAPPSATLLLSLAQRLPDARALDEICGLTNLRWIAVHLDAAPAEAAVWQDVEQRLPIERVGLFPGPVWLFRVTRSCGAGEPALRAALDGSARDATLHGTPLGTLDAAARRGRITADVTTLPAALHAWLPIEVTNDGDRTWPGATIDLPGAVQVQARMRDRATGALKQPAVAVPLGVDLAPGESVRLRVGVQGPVVPGDYVLEIGLVQRGTGWFADQPGGGALLARDVRVVPLGAPAPPAS